MRCFPAIVSLIIAASSVSAQSGKSFVGTVASVNSSTAEIQVRPDQGTPVLAKITADTILQRIAPGEKDLKKAEPISTDKIVTGDRVLVTLDSGSADARRIVVMSAEDISKRNQAGQQDWITRGVAGVVVKKEASEITLTVKSLIGDKPAVVSVGQTTVYRRYAPDSVKFADAKPSTLGEIQVGDQLRARGERSSDGAKLDAEEIVSGTFLTKAGTVVSVDASSREIRINELGTAKPLLVKLTADTQIKAMPDFGGGAFGAGLPASPTGGPPPGRGGPAAAFGGAPPDPAQMIERMPLATLEAVRPGQQMIISSTKGVKAEELTAITIVANAQMLIQMASRNAGGSGGQNTPRQNQGTGVDLGGLTGMGSGGFGFDLSGMTP